jgi:LysR family transcriptional regulator, glycine cleavage system transcriptional activator
MDFNKLRTFVAIAEHGSVSRAARELHRTQSAISQQLKGLETELELALFARVGRRLVLTGEGAALQRAAAAGLSGIEQAFAEIRAGRTTERGVLRIASIAELLDPSLAPLLGSFRAAHPRIELRVRVASNREVERMLLADEADLGLLVTYAHREQFERRPHARVECIVVATPGYAARRGRLASYSAIVEADLVDLSDQCAWIGTWIRKNAPHLRPRLRRCVPAVVVPSHGAIKSVVMAGVGVGLVPAASVANELAAGVLLEPMPRSRPVVVGGDLAVPRHGRERRLVRAFLDFVEASTSRIHG